MDVSISAELSPATWIGWHCCMLKGNSWAAGEPPLQQYSWVTPPGVSARNLLMLLPSPWNPLGDDDDINLRPGVW
jgi:hypothetical protein